MNKNEQKNDDWQLPEWMEADEDFHELPPVAKVLIVKYNGEKPNGRFAPTWAEIADEAGFTPEQPEARKRAHNALCSWRNFLNTPRGQRCVAKLARLRLEVKGQTIDQHGNVRSERLAMPQEDNKPEGQIRAEVTGWTENPFGKGAWVRYKVKKGYGLSEDEAEVVAAAIGKVKFSAPNVNGTGIGIADLSDLHTGAVLKYAVETVKTLPFDVDILTSHMDAAAEMINAYNFKEVHLFLPGDIVETFTAFNHRDSWRHVQSSQGGVTILSYGLLKRFFSNVKNLKKVYMTEGNHDRMTSAKESNSRKGIVEILAYFLNENGDVNVKYHPWLVSEEIDGVFHICTHGDHKPFLKNDFWFRYGKQGIYNVLRTGHYHGFNVLRQTNENLHYQCPSIFTGNFFSESIGFDAVPAITVCRQENGIPRIDYRPLPFKHLIEGNAQTNKHKRT